MKAVPRWAWLGLGSAVWMALTPCRGGTVVSFTNSSLLTINDSMAPPTKASPYPSTLSVSGLSGLVVSGMTVAIHGLTHGFPSDITMMLVGPQGQRTILMSQVGGQDRLSVTNVSFTLADDAANPLPFMTSLISGTYKPTDGYLILGHADLPYDLPPPLPPGNSNSVAAVSVFRNTDPNGPWSLFVVDDATGSSGTLAGWSLNITPAVALVATRVQTNIVLRWPGSVSGCTLQLAGNMAGGWSNVTNIPTLTGGQFVVTNPMVAGGGFYRLVKP